MTDSKDSSGVSDAPQEEPEDDTEPVNAARTENDEAGMNIDKSNDDNDPAVGEDSTNKGDATLSSTPNAAEHGSPKLDASSASKGGNQDAKSNKDDSRPQGESTSEPKKVDKSSGGGITDEKRTSKKQGRNSSSKSGATQKESEDPVQNGKQSRQQTTASRPAQRLQSMDESEEFLKDSYSDNNDTLLAMNFNQVGVRLEPARFLLSIPLTFEFLHLVHTYSSGRWLSRRWNRVCSCKLMILCAFVVRFCHLTLSTLG